MTNKFKVKYSSGLTEEVSSDNESVEAYCNAHFGSTWPEAQEHGASVEMIEVNGAPVLAPPNDDTKTAAKTAKKK